MSGRSEISVHAVAAGVAAAIVGFGGSFAVVLQGLKTMGADPAQLASGLMAASVAMGLCGVALSVWKRMPVSVAWSTPGAALLATTPAPAGGFAVAVGAFLACGALLTLAGLWRPLGRAVAAIPAPLASAILAGVLFRICLAPVEAAVATPRLAIPVILVWFAVAAWRRLWATPVAVLVAAALIVATAPSGLGAAFAWPVPVLVTPAFDVGALVGIALPLFLVTMASQNLPGLAVLDANGYRTAPGPLIATTGAFSLVSAPFGAHAVNLAAITAALCAGPDADPDPAKRWQAGVSCGLAYVALGLLAGVAVALAGAAPPVLIEAVAGLALLGALGASLQAALVPADSREAALMAFLVTASGVAILGIGGAFWGLVAGGAASGFARLTRRG